ncbi:hypothetical protein FRC04_011417 [Tulasnella sp. 424]|nr:hypothetical protein FRC04_011417 [Tulasnella sp. 424]KAG8971939.1 hypothetical protein FRC05_010474 [Tulasnella sp. 425]
MSQNPNSSSYPPDYDELPNRPGGLAEDVDWSAVRSHTTRGQRKYGPRTDASTSSRSSVSSGLTEQFSSSGSDTVEGDEDTRSSRANADAAPSGLFGKARHMIVKRRTKKLFLRFTTQSRHQTRTPGWRRRRDAANALIRIISSEVGGEDIVARRFVKTPLRQEEGVKAILSLGAEESDPWVRPWGETDLPQLHNSNTLGHIALQTSGAAVILLNLVVSHSKGINFFRETIPNILQIHDSPGAPAYNIQASAALPYLATAFPEQFDLIDPTLVQDFASFLVGTHKHPSICWLRGIRILDILMNRISQTPPRPLKAKQAMAAKVLQVVTEEITPKPDDVVSSGGMPTEKTERKHPLSLSLPLKATASALLLGGGSPSGLESILPDRHILPGFAKALSDLCKWSLDIDTALALKTLALMRDIPEVKSFLSTADLDSLATICVKAVLYQFPPKVTVSRKSADFEIQDLKPDEDAFDILCYLGERTFAEALEWALEHPVSKPKAPDNDQSGALRLLEPLLWLSNMPPDINIAHRVLVRSGACNFLAKIISSPVSPTWKWEEREVWRAKGQAMTCLGNIIERMDKSQLGDYVTKEMVDDVVAIKTDEEAPLAQRDQANFTLERYQIAADRCGIKSYYREGVIIKVTSPDQED